MALKLDDEAGRPNLTPETFLESLQAIRRAKRVVDEATGGYRAARKLAKDRGVDLATLAMMEGLARLDDDELATRMRLLKLYMVWDGGGEQLNLFGPVELSPDMQPKSAAIHGHNRFMAEEHGLARYKAGDTLDDNPHPGGSEQHAAWATGWHSGEASTAAQMGRNAGIKKASTKRGLKKPPADVEPPPVPAAANDVRALAH